MNDLNSFNKHSSAFAWGAFFIWMGVLMVIPGNQSPVFVLGAGLIILGLNLARFLRGLSPSPFSITLGCLAVGLGLVAMFRTVLHIPPFELPFIPAALIILGLYVLIPGPKDRSQVS
jgi:hypothetical protein